MKLVAFILTLVFLSFISCQRQRLKTTTYIGIRNYNGPVPIIVTFKKTEGLYYDSDTLNVMHLEEYIYDTFLLRTNINSYTYSFIAPPEREIGLRPMTIGNSPITEVTIKLSKDSTILTRWRN